MILIFKYSINNICSIFVSIPLLQFRRMRCLLQSKRNSLPSSLSECRSPTGDTKTNNNLKFLWLLNLKKSSYVSIWEGSGKWAFWVCNRGGRLVARPNHRLIVEPANKFFVHWDHFVLRWSKIRAILWHSCAQIETYLQQALGISTEEPA